jgi:ABC-type Fe3+/spermidine/putrescine transport system ATPase subunit
VETPAGRVAANGDRPVGGNVHIAVRPERLRMERSGASGLPAQIRDIVYRGPVTHFYLDSAAGPLIVYRQDARAGDFTIGESVRCTWDPDGAVVLDDTQA